MTQPAWHPNHGPIPEVSPAALREAATRLAAIRTAAGQDQPHDRRAEVEPRCDVMFQNGEQCARPADHRPAGSDDPCMPPDTLRLHERRTRWQTAARKAGLGDGRAVMRAYMAVADTEQQGLRVRAEQAEELLRVAEQTSNTSEAERARAVRHAEIADAITAETKRLMERRTTALRTRAERAEAENARLRAELAQARGGALSPAERQFLTFALDQAAEELSLNDGFTADDETALKNLRRMAVEAQHTPNTPPAEAEWVLETLWRTTGEWRRHWPARATRNEAEQDHERSAAQDPGRKYRIVRVETTTTVEAPPHRGADLVMPVHLRAGANAEDCPACEGTNPPYPFICPGPTTTE